MIHCQPLVINCYKTTNKPHSHPRVPTRSGYMENGGREDFSSQGHRGTKYPKKLRNFPFWQFLRCGNLYFEGLDNCKIFVHIFFRKLDLLYFYNHIFCNV